jgi:DNA-binding MarR family transcriptional regulator
MAIETAHNEAESQVSEHVADTAHDLRLSMMRLVRRLRQDKDLGAPHLGKLAALGWLDRERPMTNAELAAAERVTPQTMARNTVELVAEGLVSRTDDPRDGRQVLLRISPAGREVLEADRRRRDTFLATAMAATLTPTEQELLRLAAGLLDRLAEVPR